MRNSTSNSIPSRNFLFAQGGFSLLLLAGLLNFSCSVTMFPGYSKTEKDIITEPQLWFECDSCQYLYNTKVDVMKNHYSGIMIIKSMARETHRVVMITQMGLKIFDIGFTYGKDPEVHYMMEQLNRKMLVKTLTNDIGLLIPDYSAKPIVFSDKQTGEIIYRYRNSGRKNDYTVSQNTHRPYFIRQSKGIVNKVKAHIYANETLYPDSIKLSHYNLSLKINLYHIEEE